VYFKLDEMEIAPDDEMIDILNTTQPKDDFGPDLQSDVAVAVKRLFTNKPSKEKIDLIKVDNKLPANCKELAVPKVNHEIWSMLPPRAKQIDYSNQVIQQQLGTASVILSRTAESIFNAGNKIEKSTRDALLKQSLDSLSIIGNIMQDLSLKRKQDIRPYLSKEASAICSSSQSSEYLFGDNMTEQLKSAKATANVLKASVTRPSSFKGQRSMPYKPRNESTLTQGRSLNWQGPPLHRRGGMMNRWNRGKRSTHQNFGQLGRNYQ